MHRAAGLDAANPLAPFRDRFVITEPGLLYLDGNSLGRLPRTSVDLAAELVGTQWGDRLIRGWNEGWLELPQRVGDKIGRLLGAVPGEVIVADSTSVNLFKLATAAVAARPGRTRIVTDDLNFPSDHHVLAAVAEAAGMKVDVAASTDGIHGPEDELVGRLGDDVALVSLSATTYQSGFTYDVAGITAAAHDAGALALWDLSHAAGSVPINLADAGADLAVGCTYKYLNGGPGAPAFLYVRSDLHHELDNPVPGWMGHAATFSFDPVHRPAPGIRKFLTGTPGVVATALIEPGADLLLEAGMDTVRDVSLGLTGCLLELFDEHLAPRGFGLGSPRSERRGSHVTVTHQDALAVDQALIAAGVVPDFRPPDAIRLGVAPFYVSFVDIALAVERICEIIDADVYRGFGDARPQVT